MEEERELTSSNAVVSRVLSRLRAGDGDAAGLRRELLAAAQQKLHLIAKRRLQRDFEIAKRHHVEELVNATVVDRILKQNNLGEDLLERQRFESSESFFKYINRAMFFCLRDLEREYGKVVTKYQRQETNAPSPQSGIQPVEKRKAQDTLDRHIGRLDLLRAMESLDDGDREILQMKYFDQMSRDEIAAQLQVTVRQVNRREKAAHERMRELMGGASS